MSKQGIKIANQAVCSRQHLCQHQINHQDIGPEFSWALAHNYFHISTFKHAIFAVLHWTLLL